MTGSQPMRLPGTMGCLILAGCLLIASASRAEDAEVVSLTGRGESRETAAANWTAVAIKNRLKGGWFVRTLENSQMGLLFPDRTQIRLNQNSQLQIKSLPESAEFTQAAVKLNAGRAWSQARPQTRPAGSAAQAPLTMETPSAVMAIRGTDWEVEVEPDGRTQLVVLSGSVEIGNDQGSLLVASGEGAVAEIGKAPVKLLLVNPQERVQWVTAYRPQPRRWVPLPADNLAAAVRSIEAGDYGGAMAALASQRQPTLPAALLRADLLLYEGRAQAAIDLLSPYAAAGDGAPAAIALLARALTIADRPADARILLEAARRRNPENLEILLATGDYAIYDGDAPGARAAYGASTRIAPDRIEGWLGLGRIEVERENTSLARDLLGTAQSRSPSAPEPKLELATLAIFAGDLERARALIEALLSSRPDDYIALSARGILSLKGGDANKALEDFLRAGVIEPRYARAWLYSGVAFYQLGEIDRALQAFAKAAELDRHDPLPLVMRSMVRADALQLGEAIDDAKRARELMPYLKSLNQLLNNQKGNANLGSPLAAFGLEEWAQRLAADAYSPFWAGSHLFLADRYIGTFNKNTELFKGFLTDPTVFGASNRRSSLVASPGHYGSIDVGFERKDFSQATATLSANGLTAAPVPFAYFVSGDAADGHSRISDIPARGTNLTLGLGLRPSYEFGVFGFATDTSVRADVRDAGNGVQNGSLRQDESRADIGFNFKQSATSQVWVKAGSGRQSTRLDGSLFSAEIANSLNRVFNTNIFLPQGRLNSFSSEVEQHDVQLRHAIGIAEGVEFQWGAEHSSQEKPIATAVTFTPVGLTLANRHRVDADTLWVGARMRLTPVLLAQFELHGQRTSSRLLERQDLTIGAAAPINLTNTDTSSAYNQANPRFALQWNPLPGQNLRFATQHWRRPASVNTLAPADTLGIAVNDRIVAAGGMYRRERVQYDVELGGRTFIAAYVDRERVRNLITPAQSIAGDLELSQLDSLRNRRLLFGDPWDYYERAPGFGAGDINSVGVAYNQLVSNRLSVVLRYVNASAHNVGSAGLNGLPLPYVPRHTLNASSQWLLPQRWALQAGVTFRSARFEDEANSRPLAAGWVFGGGVHWENADKRWLVDMRLDDLHADKDAEKTRKASIVARIGYRF